MTAGDTRAKVGAGVGVPLVFVYGALMRRSPVRERGRAARAPGWAARFVARGIPLFEPRFLGLVEAPGETAWGVAAELSSGEWSALTAHEGGYDERSVEVELDGASRAARALVLRGRPAEEGLPSARYAWLVLEGAAAAGLPAEVIARYRDAWRRGSKLTLALTAPWRVFVGPEGA